MVDEVTVNDRRDEYLASAAQTEFDYTFPIIDEDHLVVLVNGVEVSNYTVTGVGDDAGGTFTFDAGLEADDEVVVYGATPIERIDELPFANGLNSAAVNDEFERVYIILQEQARDLGRSIQRPVDDADEELWDLDGGRATNAADAVDDQDLVTLAQLNGVIAGSIPDGSLGLEKLDDIADQRLLGNVSGGAGPVIALTQAQIRTFLGQSAIGTTIVTAANAAAVRAALDLEAGTDFYSIAATDAAIAAAVTGLLELKGSTDCSTNPNYPAASKGDFYLVTVAGRIGGGSGKQVTAGDTYFALADNAGGTEASVGTSWSVLEGYIPDLTEAIQDAVGASITDTATIDASYDDGTGLVTLNLVSTYNFVGVHDLWIPAGAMVPRTTNGCAALATIESASNKVNVDVLDFDKDADEFAQFQVRMPKSWNEGSLTFQPVWTCGTTGNVVWGLQAVALSDDDALDSAFGTGVTVTDGVTAAGDVMHGADSGAVTVGGSPAAGDLVVFQVYRDADNGSDTAAGDARLLGIKLQISVDAATDL